MPPPAPLLRVDKEEGRWCRRAQGETVNSQSNSSQTIPSLGRFRFLNGVLANPASACTAIQGAPECQGLCQTDGGYFWHACGAPEGGVGLQPLGAHLEKHWARRSVGRYPLLISNPEATVSVSLREGLVLRCGNQPFSGHCRWELTAPSYIKKHFIPMKH